MAKYTLVALLGIILAASAGLFLVSKATKRDAAAGPAPVQTIAVRHEGIFPRSFEVARGQPVEIRLENHVTRYHLLDIYDDSVEQLVPSESSYDQDAPGYVHPDMHIEARGGTIGSTVVRFNNAGEYDIHLTAAGQHELEIITVVVK